MLTDDECNEFRRLNMSFNDMVRTIHQAGRLSAFRDAANMYDQVEPGDNWFRYTVDIVDDLRGMT